MVKEWRENSIRSHSNMKLNWSNFLSNCGFEQYKIEKEEEETYLLFIKPIEMKKE